MTTTTLSPIHEAADGKVIQESAPTYTRYRTYGPTGEYLGWAETYFGALGYINQS